MRVPLSPRRRWPAGETIVSLPVPAIDPPNWITLYASREAWPAGARVEIALELFDADDSKWKPVVGFTAEGGVAVDRNGNVLTESYAGTRKRDPLTNLPLSYFRHVWPLLTQTRLPQMRLRVNTTEQINTRIEVDL